jgi:hypothetical protein
MDNAIERKYRWEEFLFFTPAVIALAELIPAIASVASVGISAIITISPIGVSVRISVRIAIRFIGILIPIV